MQSYDVELVDNYDYIEWAVSTPNEEIYGELLALDDPMLGPLVSGSVVGFESTEWAAKYFLSSLGAEPIETNDELYLALNSMFYYRADNFLEEQILYR